MLGASSYLLEILLCLIIKIFVSKRKAVESNDRVHRSTDLMAHA